MSRINSDRGKTRICWEISGNQAPARTIVISGVGDADELMRELRATIVELAGRNGCHAITLGIHRTGSECDHE